MIAAMATYKLLFSVVFRRMPAEFAHRVGFALIRFASAVPGVSWLLRRWLVPRDPVLHVHALGHDLPGPLGLAAGFDKDALGPDALGLLGFAFVEVGTVTAQPQPGNPAARLLARRDTAASGRPSARVLVGANIGKTRIVPESAAAADYAQSARLLAPAADYLVIHVSSPNTPGLRNLQAAGELRPLIAAVQEALQEAGRPQLPLLVKIAPDLADEDIDAIADLALEL